jgi:arylsulfatase A
MLPTFAEWTGAPLPKGRSLDGQSVAGLLTDPNYNKPHRIIYYVNTHGEVVRDGDWKLRRTNMKDGTILIELFNLSWDPAERVNLADKNPEQVTRLLPILQNFMTETSKPFN